MATDCDESINGVDVFRMQELIGVLGENAEIGQFQFQATSDWVSGGKTRVSVQKFDVGGAKDETRSCPFVLEIDEPGVLLGSNTAMNPVELLLAASISCLTVGMAYNAALAGIQVNSIRFEASGNLDVRGFLGMTDRARPGYKDISIRCIVNSDASQETLQSLYAKVCATSPVLDTIQNPTKVLFDLVKENVNDEP